MQTLKHRNEDDPQDETQPLTLDDQQQKRPQQTQVNTLLLQRPVKIKCKFCGATMQSDVVFKNGIISYSLCALAFISLPLLVGMVRTDGKIIYALKFTDDIVTVKLGEMGFILTRKIVISVLLIGLNIAVLAYKIHNVQNNPHSHKYGHSHQHDTIFPIDSTWEQFFQECNLNYLIEKRDPAIRHCFFKYIDKTVSNWDGYVIRVEDLRGTLKQYIHHAVTILILMDPTEQTEQLKFPDLQITFDSELADQFSYLLDNINRGDRIGFNATVKSVGLEGQTRHLHAMQIWKLDGYKDIQVHAHHEGRYKDQGKSIRKNNDSQKLALPEVPLPSLNQDSNEQAQGNNETDSDKDGKEESKEASEQITKSEDQQSDP